MRYCNIAISRIKKRADSKIITTKVWLTFSLFLNNSSHHTYKLYDHHGHLLNKLQKKTLYSLPLNINGKYKAESSHGETIRFTLKHGQLHKINKQFCYVAPKCSCSPSLNTCETIPVESSTGQLDLMTYPVSMTKKVWNGININLV